MKYKRYDIKIYMPDENIQYPYENVATVHISEKNSCVGCTLDISCSEKINEKDIYKIVKQMIDEGRIK